MNKIIKILGIAFVAMLAIVAIGAGVAFAQTSTPTTGYGPGWMMGGSNQTGYGPGMMGRWGNDYAHDGDSWEWMNAMHQWMSASGSMHTLVWDALAEELGLTNDDLYAQVNSGKTIVQIAAENGISRTDLIGVLETAHEGSLAQAVAGGYLTQEQADSILSQMAGRYEWMIDNTGADYGMLGGNGRFTSGGCHGNWRGSTVAPQTNP